MLEPTPGEPNTLIGGARKGIVERVKDILLTPKTEWNVIDAEPGTVGSIYTSYVMILAAIGPLCRLIGEQAFGYSAFGISYKPPIAYSVGQAVIGYVLALVSVYVSALIIDALAPSFGGTKNQVKAFKVAAYSATAVWLAGVFSIIPMLGFLAIVGLYSLYLLYLGLPRLMRVADDKAIGYTLVVIVVQVVIYAVVFMVVGILVATFFGSMMAAGAGSVRIG